MPPPPRRVIPRQTDDHEHVPGELPHAWAYALGEAQGESIVKEIGRAGRSCPRLGGKCRRHLGRGSFFIPGTAGHRMRSSCQRPGQRARSRHRYRRPGRLAGPQKDDAEKRARLPALPGSCTLPQAADPGQAWRTDHAHHSRKGTLPARPLLRNLWSAPLDMARDLLVQTLGRPDRPHPPALPTNADRRNLDAVRRWPAHRGRPMRHRQHLPREQQATASSARPRQALFVSLRSEAIPKRRPSRAAARFRPI